MNIRGLSAERVAVLVLGVVVTLIVGWLMAQFTGAFMFGLFLYYSLRPAYRRFRHMTPFPQRVDITLSILLFLVPVISILTYTSVVIAQEINSIIREYNVESLPFLGAFSLETLSDIRDANIESLLEIENSGELSRELAGLGAETLSIASNTFITIFISSVIAYYLLKDDTQVRQYLEQYFNSTQWTRFFNGVDTDFSSIFFGNILNALLAGLIGVTVFTLLGTVKPDFFFLDYPVLLGVLCGLGSLVPIIGVKLVYVPITIVLIGQSWLSNWEGLWYITLFFGVSAVIIDFIPDLLVRPHIAGRDLHVGLVVIAFVIGPLVFGWYGLFLGPAILVVFVHFVQTLLPILLSEGHESAKLSRYEE